MALDQWAAYQTFASVTPLIWSLSAALELEVVRVAPTRPVVELQRWWYSVWAPFSDFCSFALVVSLCGKGEGDHLAEAVHARWEGGFHHQMTSGALPLLRIWNRNAKSAAHLVDVWPWLWRSLWY